MRELTVLMIGPSDTKRHQSWEQLTELFRLPPHFFAAAAIFAASIDPLLDGQRLQVTLAMTIICAQLVMRAVAWRLYRRRVSTAQFEPWLRLFAMVSILSGIAWGSSLAILYLGADPRSQVIILAVGCGIVQSAAGRAYMAPVSTLVLILVMMTLLNMAAISEGQWILLPICVAYLLFQMSFMMRLVQLEVSRRSAENETRRLLGALEESNSKLRRANERLQQHALTDALTGLANRRGFDTNLAQEVQDAREGGRPLSLILLDIDHFKQFNDRHGHPAGDECLQRVADVLAHLASERGCHAARYGGEEFALVLPGITASAAHTLAEILRNDIADIVLALPQAGVVGITASLGVSCLDTTDPDGANRLIREADQRLYRAKELGRNRVISTETGQEADTLPACRQA